MPRLLAAVMVLTTLALASPAAALARWTRPIPLESGPPSSYTAPAVAIAGRGDAAVAWETVRSTPPPSRWKSCALKTARPPDCWPIVTIKVAVYTANHEKLIRSLWQERVDPTMRLSVAIARGEVTVAWGYQDLNGLSESARVAYGPLKGRWQPSRLLGHFSDLRFTGGGTPAYPRLAVALDGTVLAAWGACRSVTACPRPAGGVELAWRSPHHGFGSPQLIREAPEGAQPLYDVAGTAYLYSPCRGRILMTSPGSRRFARNVTVARGSVSDLSLSTSGAGEGLLTWVAGPCSTDRAVGNARGAVLASTLKGGVFSAGSRLTASGVWAYDARSAAVPGGGVASWLTTGSNGGPLRVVTVGAPGPLAPIPAGSEPVTSDGGGDILFTPGNPPSEITSQFVLPRRGASLEAAPSSNGELAAAPFSRLAADAWYRGGLKLSIWRPEVP